MQDKSPENSPQSKPKAKRQKKTGIKEGRAASKFNAGDKVDDNSKFVLTISRRLRPLWLVAIPPAFDVV